MSARRNVQLLVDKLGAAMDGTATPATARPRGREYVRRKVRYRPRALR